MRTGELFIVGFRGLEIPDWLYDFEDEYGLGGVILFDYNCQTKTYENNVVSPQQISELCAELSSMTSTPLLFVDQEGGKVRRLKESKGFAPLPSAQAFNLLPEAERAFLALRAFQELRSLGFDYNFAPVIDLNINPKNPDIGAVERSYSANPAEVEKNIQIVDEAARAAHLGLCLKHYPGLGGATVNSHYEFTDLSGTVHADQMDLFYRYGEKISGQSLIISHGVVKQWDPKYPVSMSAPVLRNLRNRLPMALLISDDLQMQALQKILPTVEACAHGLASGLDMVCVGNNLMADDAQMLVAAEKVRELAKSDSGLSVQFKASMERVADRKAKFKA